MWQQSKWAYRLERPKIRVLRFHANRHTQRWWNISWEDRDVRNHDVS